MKKYKQLVSELPSKKIVFAFGRFQPPTIGHELLVKKVKQVSGSADHVIYASKTQDKKKNPLPVDRKIYYLQRMFPSTNFKAANEKERTFLEVAAELNKKYKNIVMVAGSDRIAAYRKLLNDYNGKDFNFDTIEVVSAGERDPDSDTASGMSGTKMREAAKKGDLNSFKRGLPHTITDHDARRLMNEIRDGHGLAKIKEAIKYEVSDLRERYVAGKIFNIGEAVEDASGTYEIIDRGANYLTVVNSEGSMFKKWLNEVTEAEKSLSKLGLISESVVDTEIGYKGYRTSYLHNSEVLHTCFKDLCETTVDPAGVLLALKSTDSYLEAMSSLEGEVTIEAVNSFYENWQSTQEKFISFGSQSVLPEMKTHFNRIENKLQRDVESLDEVLSKKTLRGGMDKIKVARMISAMLGNDRAESSSNPEMLVNLGLRKIRTKPLMPMSAAILKRMLSLADELEIDYDKSLVNKKVQSADIAESEKVNKKSTYNIAKDVLRYKDYKKLNDVQNKGIKEEQEQESELEDDGAIERETPMQKHMLRFDLINNAIHVPGIGWEELDDDDFGQMEMSDSEIDALINTIDDEEIIDGAWEDDEIEIYDDETGEVVTDEIMKEAVQLDEILSRFERIKAGNRARRTKAKRTRKLKIALRKASNRDTINKRSRRAAIKAIKMRFARKPLNKLSTSEKERLERRLSKMKPVINRIAMRMAPKVRRIERQRLHR